MCVSIPFLSPRLIDSEHETFQPRAYSRVDHTASLMITAADHMQKYLTKNIVQKWATQESGL